MTQKPYPYSLEEFVKANSAYLTVPDMAEELDIKVDAIYYICKKLRITPIRVSEQTKNLILQFHEKLTLHQFCRKFKIPDSTIYSYCKELGITMLSEPLKKEENSTPVKIEFTEFKKQNIPKGIISKRLNTVRLDMGKYGKTNFGLRFFNPSDL